VSRSAAGLWKLKEEQEDGFFFQAMPFMLKLADTEVDGRRSGREEGRQQLREALFPTEEDALKASGLG
jgi:hypothetical protein